MKKIILVVFLLALPLQTFAISMSPPSIKVNQDVKVGERYYLEKFAVNGNGDEGKFKVEIEFPNDEYYTEHNLSKPNASWFKMSPKNFSLTKNSVQIISVILHVPKGAKNVQNKNFYAFISVSQDKQGQVRMGLAQRVQFKVSGKYTILDKIRNLFSNIFRGANNALASVFTFIKRK